MRTQQSRNCQKDESRAWEHGRAWKGNEARECLEGGTWIQTASCGKQTGNGSQSFVQRALCWWGEEMRRDTDGRKKGDQKTTTVVQESLPQRDSGEFSSSGFCCAQRESGDVHVEGAYLSNDFLQ